jgi:hypothetical protein
LIVSSGLPSARDRPNLAPAKGGGWRLAPIRWCRGGRCGQTWKARQRRFGPVRSRGQKFQRLLPNLVPHFTCYPGAMSAAGCSRHKLEKGGFSFLTPQRKSVGPNAVILASKACP